MGLSSALLPPRYRHDCAAEPFRQTTDYMDEMDGMDDMDSVSAND